MNEQIPTLIPFCFALEIGVMLGNAIFLFVHYVYNRKSELTLLFGFSQLYFAFSASLYLLVIHLLGYQEYAGVMNLFTLTCVPFVMQTLFHVTLISRFHLSSFCLRYLFFLLLPIIVYFFPVRWCYYLAILPLVPYSVLVVRKMQRGIIHYRKSVYDNYSNSDLFRQWYRRFFLAFVVWMSATILFVPEIIPRYVYSLVCLYMSMFFCHVVWSLQPPQYLQFMDEEEADAPSDDTEVSQAETARTERENQVNTAQLKTRASQRTMQFIEDRLGGLVAEGDFYRNPNVTCAQLAETVGTNRRYLSDYINHVVGKTFYAYINDLRLDYAQALLRDTTKSVDEIADASGFQTASRLNEAFFERHNFTIGHYRKVIDSGLVQ